MRRRFGTGGLVAMVSAFTAVTPSPAAAQSSDQLAADCTAAGGTMASCSVSATAASWMTRGAGLLAAASTVTPDLHRTVGRRTPGGTPRSGFDLRVAFAPFSHPTLPNTGTGAIERTQLAIGAGAVFGLFEGLQLYPAVGGVLSVDALLGFSWIMLPESEGYEGRTTVRTFGGRLGLVRESFSVPGIALTVLRSLGDNVIYTGDAGVITVDPSTTATRLAIGKDLLGLGLHAAVGRDWTSSNARLGVLDAEGVTAIFDGELDGSRTVAQGGVSLNFLVIRGQADLGWAFGGGGPSHPGLDSEGGSLFGSLAVRLIL